MEDLKNKVSFLEKENEMWLDDLEAGWAVGDLLNSSKN